MVNIYHHPWGSDQESLLGHEGSDHEGSGQAWTVFLMTLLCLSLWGLKGEIKIRIRIVQWRLIEFSSDILKYLRNWNWEWEWNGEDVLFLGFKEKGKSGEFLDFHEFPSWGLISWWSESNKDDHDGGDQETDCDWTHSVL